MVGYKSEYSDYLEHYFSEWQKACSNPKAVLEIDDKVVSLGLIGLCHKTQKKEYGSKDWNTVMLAYILCKSMPGKAVQ